MTSEIQKKRIIFGMLVGLIFTAYLAVTGADLSFAEVPTKLDAPLNSVMQSVTGTMQSIGIVEKTEEVLVTLKDLALTKVGLTFILLGGLIGGLYKK